MNERFLITNLEKELICSECRRVECKKQLPPISIESHDEHDSFEDDLRKTIMKTPLNIRLSSCHDKPLCCGQISCMNPNWLHIDTSAYLKNIERWNQLPDSISIFGWKFF
jgi:hypothetical protein